MDLSGIKLVVSDMDGTLLNSNHKVSTLFLELFEKLTNHNILFVAASGRPLYGITEKLKDIKDAIIIVAENGGIVVKNNKILLSNPIKTPGLSQIINTISSIEGAHPVFCTRKKAYVMSKSQPLLNLLSEYYTNYKLIRDYDEIQDEVYKVALFHEKSSETYIYPFVQHLESDFKVKLSATHWVDISEHIANKGYALNLIQEMFNISPDETLVFGDYLNDLEMLENAYYSVAMDNSHPNVKTAARFKTKSNDEFGVELILEKLVAQK